jgi:hypothetical protein
VAIVLDPSDQAETKLALKDVFDTVFEHKHIWLGFSGDANEVSVVVFDPPADFLIVEQLHDHGCSITNQMRKITGLRVSLLFDMVGLQNRIGDAITPSTMRVTTPISSAHISSSLSMNNEK